MKVIKKINNNVAICLDNNNNELIAFGKGIGFQKVPYELTDISKIERTYYGVNSSYISLINEIPEDIFEISAKIVEWAKTKLTKELSVNIVFTLADHIHFAIKRYEEKINVKMPLGYEIEHLYETEMMIGKKSVAYINRRKKIKLGKSEAVGIAMHFINAENQRIWVKFHLRTLQGIKNLTDQEAEAIVAKDRESHQRDLFESIEKGDYPKWLFQIQLMTEEEADNYRINPFDLTKVWQHKDFPLQDVGVLELNRNPENYFAEVEQAAFNPMNIVDGIGLSPDKMLQGRLFSYGDAQRYRLGVNAEQIPVNKPRCPFHAYHRDGAMRVDGNYGATKGYEPNSYGEWQDSPTMKEPPLKVTGEVYNYNEREYDDDYYSQPGDLFRLMPAEEQQLLFENTARAMGDSDLFIKQRHVRNCYKADPAYGTGVAKALGIDLQEALKE